MLQQSKGAEVCVNDSEEEPNYIDNLVESDDELRLARPNPSTTANLQHASVRYAELLDILFIDYADRPALRTLKRDVDISGTVSQPVISTLTYRQLGQRVRALASHWQNVCEASVDLGERVCIMGYSGADFLTVDLACGYRGAVAVPLDPNIPTPMLKTMMSELTPSVVAADTTNLDTALHLALSTPSVRTILIFDWSNEDHAGVHRHIQRIVRAASDKNLNVELLDDVFRKGHHFPATTLVKSRPHAETSIILYTSGSSGQPKGAVYSEVLATQLWRTSGHKSAPSLALAILPQTHIAGRVAITKCLAVGGTVHFSSEHGPYSFLEDCEFVRPTSIYMIPALCDLIIQKYESILADWYAEGRRPQEAEAHARQSLRQDVLGGRLITASTGSAPMQPEVRQYLESILGIKLHDRYGSTETAGALIVDGKIDRSRVVEYRLVDRPDLGYLASDMPHPRGELYIKANHMVRRYWSAEDHTPLDEDGYYRTGDIMSEVAADHLAYVDRSTNVQKLSNGRFVELAKLEALYSQIDLVQSIYIQALSDGSMLVAVVVPSCDAFAAYPSPEDLLRVLKSRIVDIAVQHQLSPYEAPKNVVIEIEPFTVENGLVSSLGKLRRTKLKDRFSALIDSTVDASGSLRTKRRLGLRTFASDHGLSETVIELLRTETSISIGRGQFDLSLVDLGVDSMSAVRCTQAIRDIHRADIPVSTLLDPRSTVRRLIEIISDSATHQETRPTARSVHGADVNANGTLLKASQLRIGDLLDVEGLQSTRNSRPVHDTVESVLITGANGYLGRFVLLEWLEKLDAVGGVVICIVRASSQRAAEERLRDVFDTGDSKLLEKFLSYTSSRLTVLAGDLGQPNLGLSQQCWTDISHQVGHIAHCGALVNHVFSYSDLFVPNVLGTAEVIRLALTNRVKSVAFTSTVAVVDRVTNARDRVISLESAATEERVVRDRYAEGYATSKWACEVLLNEASTVYGVPVTVFRTGMILAHPDYAGQVNRSDMLTRLVWSVISVGLAPHSFYMSYAEDLQSNEPHYDGLPADFVASTIANAPHTRADRHLVLNLYNSHNDGISLDTFVDWLVAAGYKIERVPHADWLPRFENALQGLPDRQRHQSVLPILDAYRELIDPGLTRPLPSRIMGDCTSHGELAMSEVPHIARSLIIKTARDAFSSDSTEVASAITYDS